MPSRLSQVEVLVWDDFLSKMREEWKQGQHVALVGPTGEAKTTAAHGLLHLRRYCLLLDPKGGDETIDGFGWPRLEKWPLPRSDKKRMQDGEPVRYIIGGTGRSPADRNKRRLLQIQVLEGALTDGGWTIYADDLQTLADRRFGRAADQIEEMLILARGAKITVVSAFQRPANVPRAAGDQATWLGVAYTRDRDVVDRISEIMGRPAPEIRGAIDALGELPFGWLWVNRQPRQPMVLTRPEKLKAPRKEAPR